MREELFEAVEEAWAERARFGGENDAVFALFGKLLYSYKLYCCIR